MALAFGNDGAAVAVTAERPFRRGPRLMMAVASGLLLSAAFPSLDLEPLAWIGLVPVLLAATGLRPRAAFGLGWLAGVVFYLATVYWVAYTITRYTSVSLPVAVAILVLMASALACYHGAFVAGIRWFEDRGMPAIWLAPALWVTLEWLRSWFFIGFPWAALGYSQYRSHDLVQVVEITGVYGLSALLVLFNVVVAELVRQPAGAARRLVLALVVLTILVAGLPLWGRWRVRSIAARSPVGTLEVGIAQGNVEQDHKWDPAYQDDTLARYRSLTTDAVARGARLVVWPETATPFFFQEHGPLRDAVLELAEANHVHLVFGSPAFRQDTAGALEELNRAYLVSPDGREVATYDKMQLVPFGEYVPYQRVLFFVDRVVHAIGQVVPGVSPTVFHLPDARFGVLVCYEDVFPALTRRFVAGGADFLVNVTNDAWYGPTSAPWQHLAQATLRAVENRTPLVRAANTGISALVEVDGRIRWEGPLFETLSHVDEIAWPGVRTFYTRFGDVFARGCALVSAVAFLVGALSRDRTARARRRSTPGSP
jgi:apolipoprotein N-acyltransferase